MRAGVDTILSTISRDLRNYSNIENLTFTGIANTDGTGNGRANAINGNGSANTLKGEDGNDTLYGARGDDKLFGGLGKDTLTGAIGADQFYFDTKLSSSKNVDTITDFDPAADKIYLDRGIFGKLAKAGALTDAVFEKNASGHASDAAHHVIYETDTGKLFYDSNGSHSGGSTLFAVLAPNLALTAADFIAY